MEVKKKELEYLEQLFAVENKSEVFLGGTFLLHKLGLLNRKPKDIDIFVYCTPDMLIRNLEIIKTTFPKTVKKGYSNVGYHYGTDFISAYFKLNDHDKAPMVNLVFKPLVYKKFKNSNFKYLGMDTVPLPLLLKAKRSYFRWKDIKDFTSMIFRLLFITKQVKEQEFKEF